MNSPSLEVSPGIGAFFAFFFLAVALWLLMRNMFGRLRRMNLAQREAEQRDSQQRAKEQATGGAKGETRAESDGHPDGPDGPDRDRGPDSAGGDGPEEGERRGDEV